HRACAQKSCHDALRSGGHRDALDAPGLRVVPELLPRIVTRREAFRRRHAALAGREGAVARPGIDAAVVALHLTVALPQQVLLGIGLRAGEQALADAADRLADESLVVLHPVADPGQQSAGLPSASSGLPGLPRSLRRVGGF